MKSEMINNRLKQYTILGLLSILSPHIITFLIIIITGDRTEGMSYFLIPSILIIHLVFSLTQIKKKLIIKLLYTLISSLFTFGFLYVTIYYDINLNIDMYGFWDLVVFLLISNIISWEILNQVDKGIRTKKNEKKIIGKNVFIF